MYQYRVSFSNPQCRYGHKYFATEAKAIKSIKRFFDPENKDACAPADGYPFNQTKAVLYKRMFDGNWNLVATFGPSILKEDK